MVKIEDKELRDKIVEYLQQFVTENRQERLMEILQYRTRHVTVVLEDLFQAQNISAVLRTCDCYGVQDVHVIQHRNTFEANKDISMGADTKTKLESQVREMTREIDETKRLYESERSTVRSQEERIQQMSNEISSRKKAESDAKSIAILTLTRQLLNDHHHSADECKRFGIPGNFVDYAMKQQPDSSSPSGERPPPL